MTDPATMTDDELDAATACEVMDKLAAPDPHGVTWMTNLDGTGGRSWRPTRDPRDWWAVMGRAMKLKIRMTIRPLPQDMAMVSARNSKMEEVVPMRLAPIGRAICEAAILAKRATSKRNVG